MKKAIVLLVFAVTTTLFSQNNNTQEVVNIGKVNLGFHGVDFSYEYAVANNLIWENSVGIGLGMSNYYRKTDYTFDLARPTPFFKSEFKYLYNRKMKCKRKIIN